MAEITPAVFDYEQLPLDMREFVQAAAARIHVLGRRTLENSAALGRELIAVKEQLQHGQWTDWLDAEFHMSDRQARYFMSIERRLGGLLFKSEPGSGLPDIGHTAARILAAPSTPDAVVEEVALRHLEGEIISPKTVRMIVSRHKVELPCAVQKPLEPQSHEVIKLSKVAAVPMAADAVHVSLHRDKPDQEPAVLPLSAFSAKALDRARAELHGLVELSVVAAALGPHIDHLQELSERAPGMVPNSSLAIIAQRLRQLLAQWGARAVLQPPQDEPVASAPPESEQAPAAAVPASAGQQQAIAKDPALTDHDELMLLVEASGRRLEDVCAQVSGKHSVSYICAGIKAGSLTDVQKKTELVRDMRRTVRDPSQDEREPEAAPGQQSSNGAEPEQRTKTYTCQAPGCDEQFSKPVQRGQPPKWCPEHENGSGRRLVQQAQETAP